MILVHLTIFFFFNDTATTKISTLSLHAALPFSPPHHYQPVLDRLRRHRLRHHHHPVGRRRRRPPRRESVRSEEHTSELQSRQYLVCRLLLEKKNNRKTYTHLSIIYPSVLTTNLS